MREYRQHRYVLDQHFRDQLTQSGRLCNGAEMAHQDRAEALTLIGIDDRESDFGFSRLDHNESCATDDATLSVFIDEGNKCDVFYKINLQKEIELFVSQFLSRPEETPEYRPGARARYSLEDSAPIIRSNGTDLDRLPAAQHFRGGIIRKGCHGR